MNAHKRRLYQPQMVKLSGALDRIKALFSSKPALRAGEAMEKVWQAARDARLRGDDLAVGAPRELLQKLNLGDDVYRALGDNADDALRGMQSRLDADFAGFRQRANGVGENEIADAVARNREQMQAQFDRESREYAEALHKETRPERVRALRMGLGVAGAAVPVVGVGGAVAGHHMASERAKRDLGRQRLLAFGAGAAAGSIMPNTVGTIGRTFSQAAAIPQQFQQDYRRFAPGGAYKQSSDGGAPRTEDDHLARMQALMAEYTHK